METFSKIINDDKPVLVDFHATWCGPCKMMAPELQRFAQNNKDNVRVLKVDIDKNQPTASEFNIQGVPTLILVQKRKGAVASIRRNECPTNFQRRLA